MAKKEKLPKEWVNPKCALGAYIKCGCVSPDCTVYKCGSKYYCLMHAADFRSDT